MTESVTATKPAAKVDGQKRTITLTFDDKYKQLYDRIIADAKEDDRTPAKRLLIFMRNDYPH